MSDNYQGPGTYRHYKGGEYKVIGLGREEATHKPVVGYKPLGPWPSDVEKADFWTRPLDEFNDILDDGTPRFTKISSVPAPAEHPRPVLPYTTGLHGALRINPRTLLRF